MIDEFAWVRPSSFEEFSLALAGLDPATLARLKDYLLALQTRIAGSLDQPVAGNRDVAWRRRARIALRLTSEKLRRCSARVRESNRERVTPPLHADQFEAESSRLLAEARGAIVTRFRGPAIADDPELSLLLDRITGHLKRVRSYAAAGGW